MTQKYLYPTQLVMQRGTVSGQALSVLAVRDQAGTQDTWNNYLEFYPSQSGLTAEFTFKIPASVTPAAMSDLTLLANYKGPAQSLQVWNFQLWDAAQAKWVLVGDNRAATSWGWSPLGFMPTGDATRFVSAARELRLRLTTPTATDNCDLDSLSLGYNIGATQPAESVQRWMPTPGTSWQIQFTGSINTSLNVKAYDLDLYDTAQTTIASLHSRGVKVICYFSGGSYENWRSDAKLFPSSVLGSAMAGWAGERWLDVRQLASLRPIMTARMDLAVKKGCDALDVDNMDGYNNSTGYTITYAQQLAYNQMMATEAHKRGLSIGLKNDLSQIKDLVDLYDFAINESCQVYSECAYMAPFIAKSKAVLSIEYKGTVSTVCSAANRLNFDTLIKNQGLDSYRVACR